MKERGCNCVRIHEGHHQNHQYIKQTPKNKKKSGNKAACAYDDGAASVEFSVSILEAMDPWTTKTRLKKGKPKIALKGNLSPQQSPPRKVEWDENELRDGQIWDSAERSIAVEIERQQRAWEAVRTEKKPIRLFV